jgi:hypothetical protein
MAHRETKLFILHSSTSFNFNPEAGLLLDERPVAMLACPPTGADGAKGSSTSGEL